MENGKLADKAPDKDTDIVLPAADTIYSVKGGRNSQVRHVTIQQECSAHRRPPKRSRDLGQL